MLDTILVCDNSSVAIKKGSKDGTTEFAHNNKPFLVAAKLDLENTTKLIVNKQNRAGIKFFLIDKQIKCDLFFNVNLLVRPFCTIY